MTPDASTAPDRPVRVAMPATPWIPVPPPGHRGIVEVVRHLCDGLARR